MELLFNLYGIHSMSGQEHAMRKFIKKYVHAKYPGIWVRQDHGNLYIRKGEAETYPCVVAHLDQVQTKHSPDFKVFLYDDVLFAYSAENGRQEGLGADDKNGIWVALKCLERFDNIKIALFKEEEIGCGGSSVALLNFFEDCRFIAQVDRRNAGDLITDISGSLVSEEFRADLLPIAERFGYKETYGMMTDVEELEDRGVGLSCINMSCGYYNPHTDTEYTKWSELQNTRDFVFAIIEGCTDVYPFKRERRFYNSYGGYGCYGGTYGYYGRGKYASLWDDGDYEEEDVASYNAGFGLKDDKAHIVVDSEHDSDYVDPAEVEPYVPDFKNFASPEDAVYSFLETNMLDGFDPYEIWPYIQSDCETYDIDFDYYDYLVWEISDELKSYYGEEERVQK